MYSTDHLLYKSNALGKDSKWCIDGQQMLHFYVYFYFMWQDFISNFCYFVYPNMHIFGKKYKKQNTYNKNTHTLVSLAIKYYEQD